MTHTIKENGLIYDEGQVTGMVNTLIDSVTENEDYKFDESQKKDVSISYSDIRQMLDENKAVAASIAGSLDKWLVPPPPKKAQKCLCCDKPQWPERLTKKYIRNNISDFAFLSTFVVVLGVAFAIRSSQFAHMVGIDGQPLVEIIIARGTGTFFPFCYLK